MFLSIIPTKPIRPHIALWSKLLIGVYIGDSTGECDRDFNGHTRGLDNGSYSPIFMHIPIPSLARSNQLVPLLVRSRRGSFTVGFKV